VRVDREVFALLARCEQARQATEGYFDITAASGGAGLRLTAEHCAVQFTRPEVVLDLGAVGKGYALDCGREILLRFGVACALLHGGGSSALALGAEEWPIAIRHPLAVEAAARVKLVNRGLSCSAVRHPGQMQSDVVNPLLRAPLTGEAACVVLAENATEAEIFSTALLAMGRERASWYLERNPDYDWQVGWLEPDAGFAWLKQ
jgi:thiamine biosynthesis lipoprotein